MYPRKDVQPLGIRCHGNMDAANWKTTVVLSKRQYRMKALRQLVLIFAVCLPLVAPAMACMIPGAHMSSAEMACCKQMATECGSTSMPVSHGCCHKSLPLTGYLSTVPASSIIHSVISQMISPALLPIFQVRDAGVSRMHIVDWQAAPAQSPPATSSILRI